MEIHAPHGPVSSLKELLTHILIVTIGILIALGLEGLRETLHERSLVSEAREGFRSELEHNHGQITREIANVRKTRLAIEAALKDLRSAGHSGQLAARLDPIKPSLYFLQNTSWDAALSTGALAHMRPKEVALYGAASQAEHVYMEAETRVIPIYLGLSAWAKADLKPDDASLNSLENQLILMASYEAIMENGAGQTLGDIESALKAPQ